MSEIIASYENVEIEEMPLSGASVLSIYVDGENRESLHIPHLDDEKGQAKMRFAKLFCPLDHLIPRDSNYPVHAGNEIDDCYRVIWFNEGHVTLFGWSSRENGGWKVREKFTPETYRKIVLAMRG